MAASAPKKTNACRALDALGIAYELRPYEFDEDDLSAETVAKKVGLPAEQVFKTLCVRADDQADSDVEAHAMWSDERLKETIRQLERSLASLRQLQVEKDRRR